jgi:hypothetical protein
MMADYHSPTSRSRLLFKVNSTLSRPPMSLASECLATVASIDYWNSYIGGVAKFGGRHVYLR